MEEYMKHEMKFLFLSLNGTITDLEIHFTPNKLEIHTFKRKTNYRTKFFKKKNG